MLILCLMIDLWLTSDVINKTATGYEQSVFSVIKRFMPLMLRERWKLGKRLMSTRLPSALVNRFVLIRVTCCEVLF